MKCLANKPKSQSRNTVVEYMTTSIAYVLFEHGYDSEEVLKILEDMEDVADSMVTDYIAFTDIRRVLKDEYHFTLNFH